MPTVTMQELELETAELLPARETLNVCSHRSGGSSFSFTQVIGSGNGNNNGNAGLVSILSGDLNGNTIVL